MSNTIYVLTEGEYSDYHIIGAYSSEELANEAKKLYPYSDIEEYYLDIIPEHPPGMVAWQVTIKDNVMMDSCQIGPPMGGLSFPHECVYNNNIFYRLWAADKEHAEKIALDLYYKHKAQEAGIA
jgi:hypothetical protein